MSEKKNNRKSFRQKMKAQRGVKPDPKIQKLILGDDLSRMELYEFFQPILKRRGYDMIILDPEMIAACLGKSFSDSQEALRYLFNYRNKVQSRFKNGSR